MLDSSEAIVEHRDYNSYGELEAAFDELGNSISAAEFLSEVGYTCKFYDSSTGLQYNNARWYDPCTGRFVSEDLTGFADGPNPYRYAGNDPVNFLDPTGLSQAGNPLNGLYSKTLKAKPDC